MPELRRPVGLFLIALCVGCDGEERKLRTWQQNQVDQLQRQAQENSAAARALVEADAESRRQFVELEQSVQAERKTLVEQYTALDADRKDLTAARERVPLLATAFQGSAAVLLGIGALWICSRLLGRLASDDGAAELEDALILSVAGESELFAQTPPLLRPPSAAPVPEHAAVTVDE